MFSSLVEINILICDAACHNVQKVGPEATPVENLWIKQFHSKSLQKQCTYILIYYCVNNINVHLFFKTINKQNILKIYNKQYKCTN